MEIHLPQKWKKKINEMKGLLLPGTKISTAYNSSIALTQK